MNHRLTLASTLALSLLTVPVLAQTVPSDLMDNCSQWKITYPTGVEDKTLCGEANNEFFFLSAAKDAIVFKAPVRSDNGTTPNSSNIRSELRERTEDGSADIYWTTEGRHVIYVKQAITHLPMNKDELVATQIHGNKAEGIDDAMVMRLEGTHLFLSFNGGVLRSNVTIKTNYALGTKHEVIFEVLDGKHYVYYSEDGTLQAKYKAGTASAYLVKDGSNNYVMDRAYDESYFKVGNYTQSNADDEGTDTDNPNNYGEVYVYDFWVDHGESTPAEPVAATAVTLTPASNTLDVGAVVQLARSFVPSNATVENVSYKSSATTVATVSSTGLVTAKAVGTAIITVTTSTTGLTATATITVIDVPTGLPNVALNKTVSATVTPDAATPANYLVDGDTATRISSDGYPQTLTIDLGALFDLSYSELVFHKDRAYQYTLSISNALNGTYTQIANRSTNTTPGTVATPLTDIFTTTGRYLKLTVTGASNYTGTWVSIQEFRAFGVENAGGPTMTGQGPLNAIKPMGILKNRNFDLLGRLTFKSLFD